MFKAFKNGLLRMPRLSIETIIDKNGQNLGNLDSNEFSLRIRESLGDESIILASKVLFDEVLRTRNDDKKIEKLQETLYKYLLRSSSRSTPYGLFAGCGIFEASSETNIKLDQNKRSYSKNRIDMEFQMEIVRRIIRDYKLVKKLKYQSNTTIYKFDESNSRYIEFNITNQIKYYKISNFKNNEAISLVINFTRKARSFTSIVEFLCRLGLPYDEAESFILLLIDNQLLTSELEMNVTGKDYFSNLVEVLKNTIESGTLIELLSAIRFFLDQKDFSIDNYFRIKERLDTIHDKISHNNLIQADLFYNLTSNKISQKAIDNITDSLKTLHKIGQKYTPPNIEKFKENFLALYGERKVSLSQALDGEIGVGYGSHTAESYGDHALIEDVYFRNFFPEPKLEFGKFQKFLLEEYSKFIKGKVSVIKVNYEDLKFLESTEEHNIFPTFYAFGVLLAQSEQHVTNENFQFFIRGISGPSGANLISRFGNGGKEYVSLLEDICRKEDELVGEDYIIAEIIHIPQDKIGNVIIRPKTRKYEIPYVGKSINSLSDQINLSDISVFIKNDQLYLYCEKLKKKIIPRLTSAHNFNVSNMMPVYKFLCEFQFQNSFMPFSWDWSFLNDQDHLPRVEFDNLILSRESWLIKHETLSSGDHNLREDLLKLYNVPRYFVVSEFDNELLIDIEDNRLLNIFWKMLKKSKSLRVQEFIGHPKNCFISDKGGKFMNELVIPFYRTNKKVEPTVFVPQDFKGQRKFALGKGWTFFKIYAGPQILEKILINEIKDLTEKLKINGYIEKWFFIRYADPEPHIRIRFFAKSPLHIIKSVDKTFSKALKQGTITRIQMDTYDREVERYGVHGIEFAENLFCNHSVITVNILKELSSSPKKAELRWQFGFVSIDNFLNSFSLDLDQKFNLIKMIRESFFNEFHGDKGLTIQLNEDFRNKKNMIFLIMKSGQLDHEILSLNYNFQYWNQINQELLSKLFESNNITKQEILNLLPHMIHMHLNRLFVSIARRQELMIHNLLFKYYEGQIAILNTKK